MNGTHLLILTMCVLRVLQRVTIVVRGSGFGVLNAILDAGNDCVGAHDTMMNGRNGCICVYCKFLLEAES